MGEVDFSAHAELLLIGLGQFGADFAVLGKLRHRCGSLFVVPRRPALKRGAPAATKKRHRGKQQQAPVHLSSSNACAPPAQVQSLSGCKSRALAVPRAYYASEQPAAAIWLPWRNATGNTPHDPACRSGTRRT